MIKSPLRYPGGKSRAVDLISTLVPEFDEFREPFLGGGSIFIYLKQRFPKKKFWVNDLHFNLFKFWEMCQKDVNAVIDKVYEWRNQFTNGKELFISNFLTKLPGQLAKERQYVLFESRTKYRRTKKKHQA